MTSAAPSTPSASEAEEIREALAHFNGSHADTVLFAAAHAAGGVPLRGGELIGADFHAIRFQVTPVDGTSDTVEWSFAEPVASVPEIQAQVFELLRAARGAAPDAELTSLERELQSTGSLPTTHVRVVANEPITAWLHEIRLRGLPHGLSSGGDEFVLVIPPEPGTDCLPPDATMQSLRDRPADQIPPMAYYTVRAWHPETDEVDLWCVVHDHDHSVARWATHAEPGATCALWGPRQGFEIGDASTIILAVDETGIPAAWAVVEDAGPDVTLRVLAEVPDASDLPPTPSHPRLSVEWLDRRGAPAGTTTLLHDAVAAMSPPTETDRDGLLVLAATETKAATAIRRLVRNGWGLPALQVSSVGYWRRTPAD